MVLLVLLGCLLSGTAAAIVLHPGECEPNLVEWTDRPHNDVVGRWGLNASCVVISPNCVITTRHQGGGVGTIVHIGTQQCQVVEVWDYPDTTDPADPDYGSVDLRIARLGAVSLTRYVDLFKGKDADYRFADMVIGGYGLGRGEELITSSIVYGYAWQNASQFYNQNLRWCTNRIEYTWDNIEVENGAGQLDTNQDCAFADFDQPYTTTYEGGVAGFDSGCGWFVKHHAKWKLAALAWGVEHADSSQIWFRRADDPTYLHADMMYAVRINSYADWANGILDTVCSDPPSGDINGDCRIDLIDIAYLATAWPGGNCSESNSFCGGSDINGDGDVNLTDFIEIAANYPEAEG